MRPTGPGKTEIRTEPASLMLFNFDIDGDALKDAHKAFLKAEAVAALKAGAAVTVIGLTDRSGNKAHNQELSERRVKSTVDFLRGEVPGGFAVKPDSRGFGEKAARREGQPNGSNDERFRSVLVFLHKTAGPAKPLRTVTLWLNAFIDNDVKNGDGSAMSFKLTTGVHAGETVIPGPFNGKVPGFDDCYLTDQRSFDSTKRDASSRIHAEVTVDFSGPVPALVQILPFGATVDTVRLRVSTGEVLNTGRGKARGRFVPVSGFVENSKRVTFKFNFAGNNPIAKAPRVVLTPAPIPLAPSKDDPPTPFDPDIDMVGTVTIDADVRTVNFRGLIDGFPFFEGYVSGDGGPAVTIFQEKPKPGENPTSGLPGPPRRSVVVDRRIR